MERSPATKLRVLANLLSIGALAAIGLSGAPAAAQYEPPPAEVIATLTPMPSARISTAVTPYPGFLRNCRKAWRKSRNSDCIIMFLFGALFRLEQATLPPLSSRTTL